MTPSVAGLEPLSLKEAAALTGALQRELGRVIIGQHDVIAEILTGFLAGGHCLLRGVPGLAKTLLIKTLAEAVHLKFSRIQFTPDLMPSDIIGTEVIEEDRSSGARAIRFIPGPVFANIILADEINRTPPKTQSALLEAMQEYQVTVGGVRHALDRPLFVLATQNPIEQEGTYPLPEAQLDRFMLNIVIDYPSAAEERAILAQTTTAIEPTVAAVATGEEIERQWVRWGAGPRAGQSLLLAGKARAVLHGRPAVSLDDIRAVAAPVLRHRLLVNFQAEAEGVDAEAVVKRLLDVVKV
jgi:MoxR-like ATPase